MFYRPGLLFLFELDNFKRENVKFKFLIQVLAKIHELFKSNYLWLKD